MPRLFRYLTCLAILLLPVAGIAAERKLKVVMFSGSNEYKSTPSLQALTKHLTEKLGAECTVHLVDDKGAKLTGAEDLKTADVAVFFTRRVSLADDQLELVRKYVAGGKGVVGIRTASHGFQTWLEFDQQVIGGSYKGHYGKDQRAEVTVQDAAKQHPALKDIKSFETMGKLYKNPQVAGDAMVLLRAKSAEAEEPVAWAREGKSAGKQFGRVFYTSLGTPEDFQNPEFLKLLTNAVLWTGGAANLQAAPEKKPERPKPAYLTIEQAGADYKVQGEYGAGRAGEAKYGVQVVALGDHQFRVVVYPGGLPGAGWSGDKTTKVEIDGKRENETADVSISGKGWSGTIPADGSSIALKSHKDESIKLTKVRRESPTMGAKPPEGAKVLFAGKDDLAKWDAKAQVDERGVLAAGARSKDKFGDCTLHLEFFLPFKPLGRGQDRGNSGVYLQDRYECQVLDSFGLKGENNECGGFYQQHAPSVNMCLPPLQWQTYDIDFTAAKFDESGKKVSPARATVRHNGVVIHDNVVFQKPTPGGSLSGKDTAEPGAFYLQGHGNPVYYRNIWVVEKR
jgi:type 1 glutamine amidotransferase